MWKTIEKTKKPVVLYGTGNGADMVLETCRKRGIPVKGVFANDSFVRGQSFASFPVMTYEEAKERWQDMCILLSYGTHLRSVMDQIDRIDREQELYAPDFPIAGTTQFTEDFYSENKERFSRIKTMLSDDQSRLVLDSVLAYKRTGKLSYLRQCETPEETEWDYLDIRSGEVFLDLGAYNGDTIRKFLTYGREYERIIGVEPDSISFRKLKESTKDLPNCELHAVAIQDHWGEITYAKGKGRGSQKGGDVVIPCDSVDNLLYNRRVTLMKMDLEGEEEHALLGAKKTLDKHGPKLHISAYHRSEDLFRLPELVNTVRDDYQWALRHTPCYPAWEVNFLAKR